MDFEKLRDQYLPDFAEYLRNIRNARISKSKVLLIDEMKVTAQNCGTVLIQCAKDAGINEYSMMIASSPNTMLFLDEVKKEITRQQNAGKNVVAEYAEIVKQYDYSQFIPFISVLDSKVTRLFHVPTGRVTDLDYDTYYATVPKEQQQAPIRAIIEFNPYTPKQIYIKRDEFTVEASHINLYRKPAWQYARELSPTEISSVPKLPDLIRDFFTHLFPIEKCREFVYDWISFALKDRCNTYLVLNGEKGIGKNILAETLMSSLIGQDNFKLAQPSMLDSNFNSILASSRFITLDEMRIDDPEKLNKLKRYINENQTIERKGVDVDKTTKTYNSFAICNNSKSDILLDWADRRFSVADLTKIKLEEAWDKDKIKELIDLVSNPEDPRMTAFGYWLLYRNPVVMVDNFHAYKGPHFWDICYASLTEWQKCIVETVLKGCNEVVYSTDLQDEFRKRSSHLTFPHAGKVDDFLKNYKHEGTAFLGKLRRTNDGFEIDVDPEWIKIQDSTGLEFESLL